MDQEAREKGNSTYFTNFVSPMLPKVLSEDLCSLRPKVPRPVLVADMVFDFTGEMKSFQFYKGLISSWARVTYGEAQEVIDGEQVLSLKEVSSQILYSAELARILLDKRIKNNSLSLETYRKWKFI